MQQRQLTFFISLVTVISATTINYFDARIDSPIVPDPIPIFANLIQLWTNVTNCQPQPCKCDVESNATDTNGTYPIKFLSNPSELGYADVDNLIPNTLYSFTLICVGTNETVQREIRTDYGRPSAPKNITTELIANHIKLSWLTPSTSNGPIHNYKLNKDRELISDKIPNTQFSYDMTEVYIYGREDVFFLSACNTNRRNESVCSNPNDGKVTFFLPMTTTRKTSSGVLSYSRVSLISLIFFVMFK